MSDHNAELAQTGDASQTNWIARAEAALDGTMPDTDADDVEVLRGQSPPLLDAVGRRTLVSPMLAGFLWAAAVFVEQLHGPLDATALVLRLLALALTVRSCVLGAEFVQRARVYFQHRRYRLALADEGFLLRTPQGDIAIEKNAVVDICEQLSRRKERGLWAPVYVVTRPPSGQLFVALPPVFAHTPSHLVEQLMSWRGPQSPADAVRADARRTTATRTAIGWRRGLSARGPYATILLGIVLLESYLRLPAPAQARLGDMVALVVTACVGVVPAAWLTWTRVRHGARRGPLLVLTTADLSVSTRAGKQRVPWSSVSVIETGVRTLWSLIQGSHEQRWLTIRRIGAPPIQLSDELTKTPIEVIAALCEACRRGKWA